MSVWGVTLVALWKKPKPGYKHHGCQKTQRNLGGAPWLGYLCRDVILFLFVFNWSACSTQEFMVPVALWSLWWIPSSKVIPYQCEISSAQWGSILSWESHLKSHRFLRPLAMMVAVLGVWGDWGLSALLNFRWAQPHCSCEGHLQHSGTGLLLSTISATFILSCPWGEGSFCLKSRLAAMYFLDPFFHIFTS